MKTIEERIQEILAEHHECRWMDSSELENCLRRIATEQKAIDDADLAEVKKQRDAYYDELISKRQRIAELESFVKKATELIEMEKAMREHLVSVNQSLINKACEQLEQLPPTWDIYEDSHYTIDRDSFIENFRKKLEESL